MRKRFTISELHEYLFPSGQRLRSDQATLHFVQDSLDVLTANVCDVGIELGSHVMLSALIYMANTWINRLV